jgi:exosortase C (VPDSG-CTERM-specific)
MARTSNGTAAGEIIIPAQKENLPGPALPVRRSTWRLWSAVCFAIVLVAAFAHPLLSLINYAAASQLYSYILLVPFVSAYLLYARRDQLPKDYASDLPLGSLFLFAGLCVLAFTYGFDFMGRALPVNGRILLLTFSFLCCLTAGGFFFLGRRWMRAAAFPFGFLIFMVPMPDVMADALETASKYASAEMANVLFHLSGTPFLRNGLIFRLPNITIEVAQQCSGIRSTVVLLITSVLAAKFFLKTQWRRFALIAFVIPLAIFRNAFRIVVIGLLCVNIGPEMINNGIHRRGGPVFFILSLVPFFAVLWWLRKSDIRTRRAKSL